MNYFMINFNVKFQNINYLKLSNKLNHEKEGLVQA